MSEDRGGIGQYMHFLGWLNARGLVVQEPTGPRPNMMDVVSGYCRANFPFELEDQYVRTYLEGYLSTVTPALPPLNIPHMAEYDLEAGERPQIGDHVEVDWRRAGFPEDYYGLDDDGDDLTHARGYITWVEPAEDTPPGRFPCIEVFVRTRAGRCYRLGGDDVPVYPTRLTRDEVAAIVSWAAENNVRTWGDRRKGGKA